MTFAAERDDGEVTIDLSGPSPLPDAQSVGEAAQDSVTAAERQLAELERGSSNPEEAAHARLTVADAWLSTGAILPALEAVRQAGALAPEHPEVLERLASLLVRSGSHLEAARTFEQLALSTGQKAAWMAAVRAYARAESVEELDRVTTAMLEREPEELSVLRFAAEVSRAQPSPETLVPRLEKAALLAQQRGELTPALAHSIDAWVEAGGACAPELFVQLWIPAGSAEWGMWAAVDAAARALAADVSPAPYLAAAHACARAASFDPATVLFLTLASAASQPAPAWREEARNVLSEAGRIPELVARMRAEARREKDPELACTAWKGIAALEVDAAKATALSEALRSVPRDAEAVELITELTRSEDPMVLAAVREGLWWAAQNSSAPEDQCAELWMLLGALEERFGDVGGALQAYSRAWKLGVEHALASVEQLTPAAEEAFARAEAALLALEEAPKEHRDDALETLLHTCGATPGALRELNAVNRILGPVAPQDDRAAALWICSLRRLGDTTSMLAGLRRLVTRSTSRAARAAGSLSLAALLDDGDGSEAIDVLLQLIDEGSAPEEAFIELAASSEHSGALRPLRAVLPTLLPDATGPTQALLARFTQTPFETTDAFQLISAALDDDPELAPEHRAERLKLLLEQLGETPSLLARRTRALACEPAAEAHAALQSAQTFATLVPLSPEATIAWFGAAGIVGDPAQLADGAIAVTHSLASARDASSVVRAAVARLFALGEAAAALRVARQAASALGLTDRALRASVLEYAQKHADPALLAELLEAAVAGASDAPGEQLSLLRRLAQVYRSREDGAAERSALRRFIALAPGDADALSRLSELVVPTRDHRALARVLSLRLASEADLGARRQAWLTLAAAQWQGKEPATAIATLERYAEERNTPEAWSEAARAAVQIDPALAEQMLARAGERVPSPRLASGLYHAAAMVSQRRNEAPAEALRYLRLALQREPEYPEALLAAEEFGIKARAVRELITIYDELHEAAAGEHGRRALSYRRASFLEKVGEPERALEIFVQIFERNPVSGALASAIERLATTTNHPEALLSMHRKLADAAINADGRIRHLLEAARVAREQMHDRRAALEIGLLAHDVKRDGDTARYVSDLARSLKGLDPQIARSAVETVVDRTLEVAGEVWDDNQKRELAKRAAGYAAQELADAGRTARAFTLFLEGTEDSAKGREEVRKMLDEWSVVAPVREAVMALALMGARPPNRPSTDSMAAISSRPRPSPKLEELAREEVSRMLQAGDRSLALGRARAALASFDDDQLWQTALQLATELGDADAELSLLDYRLERSTEPQLRSHLALRAAELLREPLNRPAEARTRLEALLALEPNNDDLIRALHDVVEQLGAWDAVATLLARRIARASDRAERRALRLHRAAVLEQRLDDSPGARAELEAILEDEPSHRGALRYLADLYLREQRYLDAGECLARAAATTPARPDAAESLALAGEAFLRGGELVAAEAQFRRALELDTTSERALRGLLEVSRMRGDPASLERTLMQLAEGTEEARDAARLRLAAARAALEAGALFRARRHVEAAREHAPPEELKALDAVLQSARDRERPISRASLTSINIEGLIPKTVEPAPAEPPKTASSPTVAAAAIPSAPTETTQEQEAPAVVPAVTPPPFPATKSDAGTQRSSGRSSRKTVPPTQLPPRSHTSRPAVRASGTMGEQEDSWANVDEAVLREAVNRGDAEAKRSLARRLARTEQGREEAARLERQRFLEDPSALDALEALVGLFGMLGRNDATRGLRNLFEALQGRDPETLPPAIQTVPEPPPGVAERAMVPYDLAPVAELGTLLWENLGNSYRKEVTTYGVTGVDRVVPNGPHEVARLFGAAARILQLPRTALFVRSEVAGGVIPARTTPPAVVLASPLATDAPVSRYMLGHAIEGTRPAFLLVSTLTPEERSGLVAALRMGFGSKGMPAGAPGNIAKQVADLFLVLPPKTQKRISEILAELEQKGTPFTEELWMRAADYARARAGLLVCGDFAVAARMVVARHRGGGEPDVPGALTTLEPLRELARFAAGEQYLLLRWSSSR